VKTRILKLICIISLLSLFSGCSKVSDEDLRAAHEAAKRGAIIIDVRSPQEYQGKHVKGAINIPVEKIDLLYSRIPTGKEIIVYCHSGSRSAIAAEYLKHQGRVVYDVATQGEWEREIPPIGKANK
jgi:phage shock protein E